MCYIILFIDFGEDGENLFDMLKSEGTQDSNQILSDDQCHSTTSFLSMLDYHTQRRSNWWHIRIWIK